MAKRGADVSASDIMFALLLYYANILLFLFICQNIHYNDFQIDKSLRMPSVIQNKGYIYIRLLQSFSHPQSVDHLVL